MYYYLAIQELLSRSVVEEIVIGKEITKEEESALYDKIKARYDEQISPYYAAARLWTDAVIDPMDTRTWISMGIEAANNAPIEKPFNMGVLQV